MSTLARPTRSQGRFVPGVAIWRATAPVAAATPPGRDRVVDLLRAGSLTVVVLGHLLMASVVWRDGRPSVGNVLAEIPVLKLATWLLQVMPLFFAAGAIANRLSYRSARARAEPWRAWLWHRIRRLVRPVVPYLAIWVPLVLVLADLLPHAAGPLGKLSTQLLWFLGVYFIVIATTPWQIRLARRAVAGIVTLLAAIALVDLARFHLWSGFGVVNFVLVWFMAATLGLVVRDRVGRATPALVALVAGALAVNVTLVLAFPYPVSLVGMPGERISNMAPPTLVLAIHAVALVALAGLAWPALTRLCAHARVWHGVVALGSVAMTLYLWHLTALVLVVVGEYGVNFVRGPATGWRFWAETPLHLLAALLVTVVLVALAAPFEHHPLPWLEPPPNLPGDGAGWSVLTGVGATTAGLGTLVLAATGMGGFPFDRVTHYAGIPLTPGLGFAMLVVGVLATRAGGRRVPGAPRALVPVGDAQPVEPV